MFHDVVRLLQCSGMDTEPISTAQIEAADNRRPYLTRQQHTGTLGLYRAQLAALAEEERRINLKHTCEPSAAIRLICYHPLNRFF